MLAFDLHALHLQCQAVRQAERADILKLMLRRGLPQSTALLVADFAAPKPFFVWLSSACLTVRT
jgi:hypothetical protein